MGILLPDPGLVFWTALSFLTLLFILTKFAWKPMLGALKARDEHIQGALNDAERAKEELQKMEETRLEMLESTKAEKDKLIKEAQEIKAQIVAEAKDAAQTEGAKIIEQARKQIERERESAIIDLRKQVGLLSIEIAEKILKEQMNDEEKQKALVNQNLDEINFN